MRIGRAESMRWGVAMALLGRSCGALAGARAAGSGERAGGGRGPRPGRVGRRLRRHGAARVGALAAHRARGRGGALRPPNVESARRGTLARGARLAVFEATQGRGCRTAWIRIDVDAWVCADGATLTADGPLAARQPVVREGEVVPYQYAFATHAGVRTYRRMEDVTEENWAEELERGMSVAVVGAHARIDGSTYVHTASGRWVSMRRPVLRPPSERAGIFYEPGESVTSVGFLPLQHPGVADRGVGAA